MNSLCSSDVIQAYLDETIDRESEENLLEHLETCAACQAKLNQTAASQELWESVQTHLIDQEHDLTQVSHPDVEGATAGDFGIQSVLAILKPTDLPQMLGRLGPYEISGVIGAGGMGVVLKGWDSALDRTVAIKVIAPHLAASGAARARFAREARAAAAVLHPNVMAIHSVANEGTLPYLVMPYLRGESLQNRIDQKGMLELIEILRVAQQIAAGLAAAHSQGLVHRDIKPANIMLADGIEQVAITDFGLARTVDDASMTRTGIIAGTPNYMSPEQARGESVGAASDLFSLGSVIYTMCTGRAPFRAEGTFGVLRRITDDTPRDIQELNSSIPGWLSRLVALLHVKEPGRRIGSAGELAQILSRCLAHAEQPKVHELPPVLEEPVQPRFVLPAGRSACVAGVCLGCLLLAFGLAYWEPWQSNETGNERPPESATGASSESGAIGAEKPGTANTREPNSPSVPIPTYGTTLTLEELLLEQDRVNQDLLDITIEIDQLEDDIQSLVEPEKRP